jgi:molybdate transport system substrate-binding protein
LRRGCLALLLALASACSGDEPDRPPTAVVRVLAASSLTDVFQALGDRFVEQRDGVRVDFTFSASDVLVDEVGRGRPASVLATAVPAVMDEAEEAGLVRDRSTFARNRLALIVEADNPKGVATLADLDRADVSFATCVDTRACGALAAVALDRAGVGRAPDRTEETARSVLQLVERGAVDAGLVFVTTPTDEDEVATVASIDDRDVAAVYEMGVLFSGAAREASQSWVDFVLGVEGRRILADHGFDLP